MTTIIALPDAHSHLRAGLIDNVEHDGALGLAFPAWLLWGEGTRPPLPVRPPNPPRHDRPVSEPPPVRPHPHVVPEGVELPRSEWTSCNACNGGGGGESGGACNHCGSPLA